MTPNSTVAVKYDDQLLDLLKRKFSLEYEACAYSEEFVVFHTVSQI
jgi:hypothetical protein